MSTLFVKIVTYTIKEHPNADALVLANPIGTGWQCCIRKDGAREGELAVYIPIDSMLPAGMASKIGLPNAKEDQPFRVHTIKLRGALSQGLLLPITSLVDGGWLPQDNNYSIGEDVAELLNIIKWEPPQPEAADLICNPSGFSNYTSPEHYKNFPNVIKDGDIVVLTEKLHGSSWKAGWVQTDVAPDGSPVYEFFVGTKRDTILPGADNKYLRVAKEYDVEQKLKTFPGYVVYGELFGKGIQSLQYGQTGHALRIFDVRHEGRFLNWNELKIFASETGLPLVPIIYEGAWSSTVMSHRFGSAFEGGHIREGFVVKPVAEAWDYESALGRVILKVVSEDYWLSKRDADEIE